MNGIRIRNLGKHFGAVAAVRGIDLDVPRGSFVTLLGPSGSGKTTTLRMIAGLDQPDAGVIEVGGRVLYGPGVDVPTFQRNMGMVFQSYALWPHKSVYENVAFPLRMRNVEGRERRQRVERILELVELPGADYGARFPSQLSGGQQQRVSLARALVAEPQVMLFDEPLSNLDARLRDSMRALLRSVHDRLGLTSLYVTHDQAEALVLSDEVCVMRGGGVVQHASPREIYERPADLFVAEFIGQANAWPITDVDVVASTVFIGERLPVRVSRDALRPDGAPPTSLLLRYHHARLRNDAALPGGANRMRGRIEDTLYMGDRIRYRVDLGRGCRILVEAGTEAGVAPFTGDVDVELPVDGCVVVY